MKIRTKLELKDYLDKDLAWRKRELSSILSNIKSAEGKVLDLTLRTSMLLLYAHWEGFIKTAGEAYLNFVSFQNLALNELSDNFLAIAMNQKIKTFNSTKSSSVHCEFIKYFKTKLTEKAIINSLGVVYAASNLNSKILEQILITLGIDYTPFELKANIIDEKLLGHRNSIAHGEKLRITKSDYELIHKEIFDMINQIKTSIENEVALNKYKV